MTCSSMPTEAKKRRVEYDENLNHLDSYSRHRKLPQVTIGYFYIFDRLAHKGFMIRPQDTFKLTSSAQKSLLFPRTRYRGRFEVKIKIWGHVMPGRQKRHRKFRTKMRQSTLLSTDPPTAKKNPEIIVFVRTCPIY